MPSGAGSAPDGVAVGPNGSIWFTEFGADKIGTIDPTTHAISEFTIPTRMQSPRDRAGPDGNFWFTEFNTDQIGMINPTTHKITEYPIPTMDAEPFGITAGPNNTVWFTEWSGNQIGSVNIATGKVTEYPIPTLDAAPEGIMQDSAGNIWFTESVGNKIAMYDPTTETYTEHALPNAGAEPYAITAGPGGNLYFTEYTGNQIGVYSPSSSSFLTSLRFQRVQHGETPEPTGIASAPDGSLWFTQSKTNQVAMLNTSSSAITEVTPPTALSGPRGIAAGSDGSIWFAELNTGKMATIAPSLQIARAGAPSLSMKVGSTFGLTVDVEYQSGGAIDTGYDGTVSLSIPGAAPGTLAGNTSVTATNGVATFTGLSFTDSGSFSIQVTSGSAHGAFRRPDPGRRPYRVFPGQPRRPAHRALAAGGGERTTGDLRQGKEPLSSPASC